MGQQVNCCKAYGKGYMQIEETRLSLLSMAVLNIRTESHRTGAQDTSLEAGAEAELTSLLAMVCSVAFLFNPETLRDLGSPISTINQKNAPQTCL